MRKVLFDKIWDVHYTLNNEFIPITVCVEDFGIIFSGMDNNTSMGINVDLPSQLMKTPSLGQKNQFEIDDYKKMCLLIGYDDINYYISISEEIKIFEKIQVIY